MHMQPALKCFRAYLTSVLAQHNSYSNQLHTCMVILARPFLDTTNFLHQALQVSTVLAQSIQQSRTQRRLLTVHIMAQIYLHI